MEYMQIIILSRQFGYTQQIKIQPLCKIRIHIHFIKPHYNQ